MWAAATLGKVAVYMGLDGEIELQGDEVDGEEGQAWEFPEYQEPAAEAAEASGLASQVWEAVVLAVVWFRTGRIRVRMP